ncbi:MAG: glutamate--tRNA ligase, partial [Muribaculaceae bacterium]|nr:glutamate--tRNA ligase [Muribaculaceae bacterium]
MNKTSSLPDVKGRFAPAHTGRMHLGNVYTALISWLSAKSAGGTWLLRIEDLDPQRSKYEYARQIEDDLHWLGLEWDEGGLD